jgi:GrpB-like predicted nucleotidyltransferase (UPF0157 family)
MLSDVITVCGYNPAWPDRFEALRMEYHEAFAEAGMPVVAIEHVGSTSVPGLAAKPVIDCDIVVAEKDVAAATGVLISLGFSPLGELGIPERWAFKEPARLAGTNTYVIVDGSLSLRNHLAVRDTLRARPKLRDRYAAEKQRVGRAARSLEEYGKGKNAVIQEILAAAGLTDAERASIDANQVPSLDEVPR